MKNKRCPKCHKIKLLSDFYKNKSTKCGATSICIDCIKLYRKTNKERTLKNARKFRLLHREERNKSNNDYRKERKEKAKENPKLAKLYKAHALLSGSRKNAKIHNVEHTLVLNDLINIPKLCPVLGIPLNLTADKCSCNSPSVDRIDPKKGYTKDNICIISHKANFLKSDATLKEINMIITYIKSFLK